MKIVRKSQPKVNRVRVLIQSLTDKGKPVGGKAGYDKNKQISLYETTVEEVYGICLKTLTNNSQ